MELLELLSPDVKLRRIASTHGGEYCGPCPFCRDGDDRFRVWPNEGRWWCRRCDRRGDAIQYLRELHGATFQEASHFVGRWVQETGEQENRRRGQAKISDLPGDKWQERALSFVCRYAEMNLWYRPEGEPALAYLRKRGLTDATILYWGLGFNPEDMYVPAHHWGLEGKDVWCPRGIVIPSFTDTPEGLRCQYIKVRRPIEGDDLDRGIGGSKSGKHGKYVMIRGSVPRIFGLHDVAGSRSIAFVEGEFDAMLLNQEAGDVIKAVTQGSATYRPDAADLWALRDASRILAIFDADAAGATGAAHLKALSARVSVHRPDGGKDITDMLSVGIDMRNWILQALSASWQHT
jgi:DNA primase